MESIYNEVKAVGGEIFLIGPETDELAMQLMEKTKATIPKISPARFRSSVRMAQTI